MVITEERAHGEVDRRWHLNLDKVWEYDDPSLRNLLERWNRGLPLDTEKTFIIDVSSDDFRKYRILKHPKGVVGDQEGREMAEHSSALQGLRTAMDYWRVKRTGKPLLTEYKQSIVGIDRHLARIAVPRGPILYYAFAFLEEPVFKRAKILSMNSG